MKLEKAIDNLIEIQTELASFLNADNLSSIQLGIEALKRRLDIRVRLRDPYGNFLPGETED